MQHHLRNPTHMNNNNMQIVSTHSTSQSDDKMNTNSRLKHKKCKFKFACNARFLRENTFLHSRIYFFVHEILHCHVRNQVLPWETKISWVKFSHNLAHLAQEVHISLTRYPINACKETPGWWIFVEERIGFKQGRIVLCENQLTNS